MSHRTAAVALALVVSGILAWFLATGPRGAPAPAPSAPVASAPSSPPGASVASPASAASDLSPAPASPAATAPAALPAPRSGVLPGWGPDELRSAGRGAPSPPEAQPQPTLADLAPRSPGALRGALLDAAGRPLADVAVLAVAADGSDAGEDVTDGEGRFLLLGLRPGRYAVFAGLGTPVAARVGARGATVEPAGVTDLALRARAAGATVRVHAVALGGRALETQALLVPAGRAPAGLGAVLASEAILLPGASRTEVEAVPPGRWTVILLSGDDDVRAPAQVEVADADLDVEVRLAAPVSVL